MNDLEFRKRASTPQFCLTLFFWFCLSIPEEEPKDTLSQLSTLLKDSQDKWLKRATADAGNQSDPLHQCAITVLVQTSNCGEALMWTFGFDEQCVVSRRGFPRGPLKWGLEWWMGLHHYHPLKWWLCKRHWHEYHFLHPYTAMKSTEWLRPVPIS